MAQKEEGSKGDGKKNENEDDDGNDDDESQVAEEDGFDADEADAELEKQGYKWNLQWDLHHNKDEKIKTYDLLMKDDMIVNQFNITINDLHCRLSGKMKAQNTMMSLTQDALVGRIHNFPTPLQSNTLLISSIPKVMLRNKQILEDIFSYLQGHPCYVITWINKIVKEPAEIGPLIDKIYGSQEKIDDPRILNTLTVITRSIFDRQLR